MLSAEGSYTIAYPLSMIAAARNRPDLAAMALAQLQVRRERLWHDGALWLRRYDDERRTFRGWARGTAWYLLGASRSITPLRRYVKTDAVEADLRRAADWLLPLQRPDGLWSCFVEDPHTPADTSGSAGIAAALAHGARLGVLSPAAGAAARRALAALYLRLTPDGLLDGAAQSNRGGEQLQRSDYRVLSQMGMGLLAQLIAECDDAPLPTAQAP
jgi:rhamnogalacturonyl hydrolase YesR